MIVQSSVVADTSRGRVRGATERGIHAFRGVPYGGPTAGERRFRPPVPAERWSGVRDALAYGPAAPQAVGRVLPPGLREALGTSDPLDAGQSEDCLVLNVWTPGLNDGGRRPIMVWIHGGGYYAGSAASRHTDGHALARRGDAVVVTLNHRLGVLGYLRLEHLLGESYASAGVAGMLDLVLALEWVRDNAEQFGGDPNNVTIFGCSGGGSKVSHLLAMPRAKGLFHKAVVESGPGLRSLTPQQGANLTARLLAALGLGDNQAAQLLALPAVQLIEAQSMLIRPGAAMLGDLQIGPLLTPGELDAHPFDPAAAACARDVPLIIGSNRDEMAFGLGLDPRLLTLDDAAARAWAIDALGQYAERLFEVYRQETPTTPAGDLLIRLLSDFMRMQSIRLAERKATGGSAPVYMYLFGYETDVANGRLKACHSLEVPFVFDNAEAAPITGTRPQRRALAAQMSEAWLAFARSGNPTHAGMATWPEYDTTRRATMVFDVESERVDDPAGVQRRAWDAVVL